jgi:putative glutamine amidotransferase
VAVKAQSRPRVGVPWRTSSEERADSRAKIEKYLRAVERAGGEAVPVSLDIPATNLKRELMSYDAFVLTGSPADVNPEHFHAQRHPATADPDPARERTDFAILEHAFSTGKPVLAICYGAQSLNVFLGGSLVQDIPSEIGTAICHSPGKDSVLPGTGDPLHDAHFKGGRIFNLQKDLLKSDQANVNSSHHQSILEPGRGLRVTGRAPDGVVEAVEWIGDLTWIIGVQWHPERMPEDLLAQALFQDLIEKARQTRAKA